MSGEILSSQIRNLSIQNISEILNTETIKLLDSSENNIAYSDDYLIRRIQNDTSISYFFTENPLDTRLLSRDILRFLLLDIVLLVPIWLGMRMYIGKTLAPVKENIETMNHFVHDA